MMEFIRLITFIKTQILADDHKQEKIIKEEILTDKKDLKRFS